MKKTVFILAIFATAILQITVADYLRIFNVKPDLLLIPACLGALFFGLPSSLAFALLSGVLKDSVSINPFGTNTLLFSLWCFLVFRLAKKISVDSELRSAALIFLIAIAHNTILGLMYVYSGNPVPTGIFLRIVSIGSVYTALITPLYFRLIKR